MAGYNALWTLTKNFKLFKLSFLCGKRDWVQTASLISRCLRTYPLKMESIITKPFHSMRANMC